MIHTMTQYDFLREWPESRRDQFSEEALVALFEFYERLGEDCGQPVEFDPIAICCDWTEWDDIDEFREQYALEVDSWSDVAGHTITIPLSGGAALVMAF